MGRGTAPCGRGGGAVEASQTSILQKEPLRHGAKRRRATSPLRKEETA